MRRVLGTLEYTTTCITQEQWLALANCGRTGYVGSGPFKLKIQAMGGAADSRKISQKRLDPNKNKISSWRNIKKCQKDSTTTKTINQVQKSSKTDQIESV